MALDSSRPEPDEALAPPFVAIFGDRATAEWAFDLFAETVTRLGGWTNDPRFALTLPHGRRMLRLNLGNWLIMDVSARRGVLHLAALIEPMERAYPFPRGKPFARADNRLAVFAIPLATARAWPDELDVVYKESMLVMAERFGSYGPSPHRRAHQVELFQALFDRAERERLFAAGLPTPQGQSRGDDPQSPARPPPAVHEPAAQWTVAEPRSQPYTRDDFLRATYVTEPMADELHDLLLENKQLILYGPPGTGKTHVARALGRWLTGLADPPPERLTVIQFHPAYSYEEFIEGIRPESRQSRGRYHVDYPARPGIFVRFCQQAARVDGACLFVIDEINRGNIARIFGELLFLLEYRDYVVTLPYSGQSFHIPKNVLIIGTMNTADRSIALVDFALRRRFHFYRFCADPEILRRWLKNNPNDEIPYLYDLYFELTDKAIPDENLRIGPSHFMQPGLTEEGLARVWKRSIEPYLEEFHFGKPRLAKDWAWDSDTVSAIRNRNRGD